MLKSFLLFLTFGTAAWAQNATSLMSDTHLAADPGTCSVGDRYFNTVTNLNRICGPINTWSNQGSGTPGGTSGQLQDNNGGAFRGITLGGDCTYSSPNITCTKTSGSVFGAMALLTATAATDLSGTWPNITVAKLNGQLPATTNTASTVVVRDASGNFAAGTITASLTGTATGFSGQVAAANLTVLTTTQDILYRSGSALARLPIVTNGSCLGASAGAWATLSCGGGSGAFAGINAQTIAYTLLAGDNAKLVTSNGTSLTDLLPAAAPSATWSAGLQNLNSTPLTVSRNGLLINGAAANMSLLQYQSAYVWTDGANYFVPQRPLAAGTGITLTESATSESVAIDSTTVLTNANAQAGKPTYCADSSGTTSYTCLGSPSLTAYSTGMQVFLKPSATCSSSCGLNIDFLGNKSIKQADGSTDPGGLLQSGQGQWLWYDGTVFRLTNSSNGGTGFANAGICPQDGVTDATACINSILAANLNVYFPNPTVSYYINGALQLKAGQNILCDMDKQPLQQGLVQHSTTSDTFFASFATSGVRQISIRGCMIYDAVRGTRTTGAGIKIDGGTGAGSGTADLVVYNNMTYGFQDGLWTGGTFFSAITQNRWTSTLRDGWHACGRSLTLDSDCPIVENVNTSTYYGYNYGDGDGRHCMYINGLNYSVIEDNACDNPIGSGYVTDTTGSTTNRGLVFVGNGAEGPAQNGYLLDGEDIKIEGGAISTSHSGTGFSGIKFNGCVNCSVGKSVRITSITNPWDYCIDQSRSPLHAVAFWQLTNAIEYPLPFCSGSTLGYLHDAGGVNAGSVTVPTPVYSVLVATAAVLPNTPTYSNTGILPGGFGATLTAGSNTTLTVDGHTMALNERVLVKNQASTLQNGVYVCTQIGSGAAPWILSRPIDYTLIPQMNNGSAIHVQTGTANAATAWLQTSQVATIGTSALTYVQIP